MFLYSFIKFFLQANKNENKIKHNSLSLPSKKTVKIEQKLYKTNKEYQNQTSGLSKTNSKSLSITHNISVMCDWNTNNVAGAT